MNRFWQHYFVSGMTAVFYFLFGFSVAQSFPTVLLSAQVDMDFGLVEYATSATGSIDMGTDANIAYTGMFSGPAIGTSAQFRVRVTNGGGDVSVECDTGATLTSGGNSVALVSTEFVLGAGNRTAFGGGNLCAGLGTTIQPFTVTDTTLYVGGSLDISSAIPAGGVYSSTNGGGNPITFRVLLL